MKALTFPIKCYAHRGGGAWLWVNRVLETLPDDLCLPFARNRKFHLPASIHEAPAGLEITLSPAGAIRDFGQLAESNLHLVRPHTTASGRLYLPKRIQSTISLDLVLSAHNAIATLSRISRTTSYLLAIPLTVRGGTGG
jgi:hypothetical protein